MVKDKIAAFIAAKEKAKEAEDKAKEAKAEAAEAEQELIAAMVEEELDGIKAGDRMVSINTLSHFSFKSEDSEQVFEALRKIGLGDLVKEKVDQRTLSAALREQKEHGGIPAELVGLVNEYEQVKIGLRKAN